MWAYRLQLTMTVDPPLFDFSTHGKHGSPRRSEPKRLRLLTSLPLLDYSPTPHSLSLSAPTHNGVQVWYNH